MSPVYEVLWCNFWSGERCEMQERMAVHERRLVAPSSLKPSYTTSIANGRPDFIRVVPTSGQPAVEIVRRTRRLHLFGTGPVYLEAFRSDHDREK
jgi:hypothetical protein